MVDYVFLNRKPKTYLSLFCSFNILVKIGNILKQCDYSVYPNRLIFFTMLDFFYFLNNVHICCLNLQ